MPGVDAGMLAVLQMQVLNALVITVVSGVSLDGMHDGSGNKLLALLPKTAEERAPASERRAAHQKRYAGFECYMPKDEQGGCPSMDWYDVLEGDPIPAGETRIVSIISPFWQLNGCTVTVASHQPSMSNLVPFRRLYNRVHRDRLTWRLLASSQRFISSSSAEDNKKSHEDMRLRIVSFLNSIKNIFLSGAGHAEAPIKPYLRWGVSNFWHRWMVRREAIRQKKEKERRQHQREATYIRQGDPLWQTYTKYYQVKSESETRSPQLHYDIELLWFEQSIPVSCGTTCKTSFSSPSAYPTNSNLDERLRHQAHQKNYSNFQSTPDIPSAPKNLSSSSLSAVTSASFYGAALAMTCRNRIRSCLHVRYRVECDVSVMPLALKGWFTGDYLVAFVVTLLVLFFVLSIMGIYLRQYHYYCRHFPFDLPSMSFIFPLQPDDLDALPNQQKLQLLKATTYFSSRASSVDNSGQHTHA